jgi:hypothetical protein
VDEMWGTSEFAVKKGADKSFKAIVLLYLVEIHPAAYSPVKCKVVMASSDSRLPNRRRYTRIPA